MSHIILVLAAVMTLLTAGAAFTSTQIHSGVVKSADATPPGLVIHPMDANVPTGL
jgi:hypothetical protein